MLDLALAGVSIGGPPFDEAAVQFPRFTGNAALANDMVMATRWPWTSTVHIVAR